MKSFKLTLGVITLATLSGCRQELTDLTYQLDAIEPLVVTRKLLADKFLVDTDTTTNVALRGCIQTPDAWGAPTDVSVVGSANGTPFTAEPPDADPGAATSAQTAFPRADHSWYCYTLEQATYSGADTGTISWTFAAGDEPAKIATSIGTTGSLTNLVIHDVTRNETLADDMWAPLEVTLAGDALQPISTAQSLSLAGTFGEQALLQRFDQILLAQANGTVTAGTLPFNPISFSSTNNRRIAISPTRLLGFADEDGEAASYTSTNGTSWSAAGGSLPDSAIVFATYNAGLGLFVASLEADPNLYYSANGANWTTIVDTGATDTSPDPADEASYASLPDGTEAVRMKDSTDVTGLFVRPAGGSFTQTLSTPENASEDWSVRKVISAGERFYVLTADDNGPSGPEYTLLSSIDGSTWTQVAQDDTLYSDRLRGAAIGDRVLLIHDGVLLFSTDGGANFTTATLADSIANYLNPEDVTAHSLFTFADRFYFTIEIHKPGINSTLLFSTFDGSDFTLSASQLPSSSLSEFSYFPVAAGNTLLQIGEGPDGWRAYRQIYLATDEPKGKSNSGGAVWLVMVVMLIAGLRRQR